MLMIVQKHRSSVHPTNVFEHRLFNNDAHHNPKALRSSCSSPLHSKFMEESPLRAIGQENISFSAYRNNNCLNASMNRSKDSNIFNISVPPVNINPFSRRCPVNSIAETFVSAA